MAKYIEKKIEVDAEQFDSSKSQSQWPVGIQTNALSPTGYSYGTLAEIQAPMGPGYVRVDGFPIDDFDFLITPSNGIKFVLNSTEFSARYTTKNGAFMAASAPVDGVSTKRRR